MTQHSSSSTVAGWYGDPSDAARLRWWDGTTWTADTRAPAASPEVTVDMTPASVDATASRRDTTLPAAADPTEPPLTRRALREREAAAAGLTSAPGSPPPPLFAETPAVVSMISPSTPETNPTSASSVPSAPSAPRRLPPAVVTAVLERDTVTAAFRDESGFVRVATPTTPVSIFTPRRPIRVNTVAVWLLALLPLPWAAGVRGLTGMMPADDLWMMRGIAVAVFILLSLLFAFRDGQVLRAGRHSETASAFWVLLTPLAFLVGRTIKVRLETGVRSSGPALVWLLAVVAAIVVVAGGALSRAALATV